MHREITCVRFYHADLTKGAALADSLDSDLAVLANISSDGSRFLFCCCCVRVVTVSYFFPIAVSGLIFIRILGKARGFVLSGSRICVDWSWLPFLILC